VFPGAEGVHCLGNLYPNDLTLFKFDGKILPEIQYSCLHNDSSFFEKMCSGFFTPGWNLQSLACAIHVVVHSDIYLKIFGLKTLLPLHYNSLSPPSQSLVFLITSITFTIVPYPLYHVYYHSLSPPSHSLYLPTPFPHLPHFPIPLYYTPAQPDTLPFTSQHSDSSFGAHQHISPANQII
jgi:hypothetical protein